MYIDTKTVSRNIMKYGMNKEYDYNNCNTAVISDLNFFNLKL